MLLCHIKRALHFALTDETVVVRYHSECIIETKTIERPV